jgi:hypothetical protein
LGREADRARGVRGNLRQYLPERHDGQHSPGERKNDTFHDHHLLLLDASMNDCQHTTSRRDRNTDFSAFPLAFLVHFPRKVKSSL